MNIWVIIFISGIITFLIRLSFIAAFGKLKVPPEVQSALKYVPPAVLSAIVLPDLLMHTGKLDVSLGNTRLLAGVVAILVAWRTRNILLTILLGMGTLFLLKVIMG